MNHFNSFELGFLHDLQNIVGCDFLDWLMPKITLLGNHGIFWIVFAVGIQHFNYKIFYIFPEYTL